MRRTFPILAAICLVAIYGLAEGFWSNRWNTSHALEEAVARLKTVPLTVGEWQGKDETTFDEQFRHLTPGGYLVRTYFNRRTYQSVQVLIICGIPGPTAVHTPDVCYQGAGFTMQGQIVRHTEKLKNDAPPADLKTAEFQRSQGLLTQHLRIYWAWSCDGKWVAPGFPRWHFASQPAVYKFYLIRPTFQASGAARDTVCMDFLAEFLPQLNQALFPTPASKN
jgi:hypothetical protein